MTNDEVVRPVDSHNRQACIAAAIFEFVGAVTVGARVSGTIKNGIVPIDIFQNNAGVGLLAFSLCLARHSESRG